MSQPLDKNRHSAKPQSVYSFINLVLRLSQPFGAAPLFQITSPKKHRHHATPTTLNRIARVLHLIWSVAYALLLGWVMYNHFVTYKRPVRLVEKCLFAVRFISSWVTTVIILVSSRRLDAEHYQYYFDEMDAFDRRLMRLDGQRAATRPEQEREGQRRWLVICVVFYVVFVLLELIDSDWQPLVILSPLFAYVVPSMTASCVLLQLVNALHMLERRFARIGRLVERQLSRQFEADDTQQRQTMAPLTPQLWACQRPHVSTRMTQSDANNAAAVLNAVRLEHIGLTAMHNRLIDDFSLAVIGIVLTGILDLTVQLYQFYKISVTVDPPEVLTAVYSAVWFGLVAGRIFVVVAQCDRVTQQRRQIAPAMFQVELNGTMIQADIDRMIGQFALQLLHDVRDQRRLAGGVLPLNVHLMATLAGVVTVYLVIMIQFDASERNVA